MTTFESIFPLILAAILVYAGCVHIWTENKKR